MRGLPSLPLAFPFPCWKRDLRNHEFCKQEEINTEFDDLKHAGRRKETAFVQQQLHEVQTFMAISIKASGTT